MGITVGDNTIPNETTVCPFPRKWYGPESPCSHTDDPVTGAPQEPWVQGPSWIFYGALALLVFWLGVRALESLRGHQGLTEPKTRGYPSGGLGMQYLLGLLALAVFASPAVAQTLHHAVLHPLTVKVAEKESQHKLTLMMLLALLLGFGVLSGCDSDEISSTGAQKSETHTTVNCTVTVNGQQQPCTNCTVTVNGQQQPC